MVERGQSSLGNAMHGHGSSSTQRFMVERGRSWSGNALHGNGRSNAQRFMVERGQSWSGNASHGQGSSSTQRFMVERGQSSSVRDTERPMAKYLAEKMFREAEPQSSSPRCVAKLMRLEGLNSLWNSKQKSKLPDGHHQNDVSIDIEPDRQPHGCLLYNRRMPRKKQQVSEVNDDPEVPHFVNPRRSSEWRVSSMPTVGEMGVTRQKIDTKRLSFGQLIDPLDLQSSRDMLMNYARRLDSANVNRQGSSSSAQLERMDGLLLELQNHHGALTSHRISRAQAEEKKKKKKNMFPRPIVFPRSGLRNISTAEASSSSAYPSRDNIPDFRRKKEYPGVGTSEEASRRSRGSYHDAECSNPISRATRNLGRGSTRQLEDARDESEDEMYPGSREFMGGQSLYDSYRSDFMSSGSSSIDDYRQGRHPSRRSVDREDTERLLASLKIIRTYRDSEVDDDPSVLREVIVVPDGRTRSNTFAYSGGDRPGTQLGTNNRSSVLHGVRSGPWNETQRSSCRLRSRSLPPSESRVHRRDRFQGSTSMNRMPLPFPPIRISHNGSSLEATFEIQMESDADDFSEQQLRSPVTERDDLSEDTVHDIMIDRQEITTLSSEHSALHPRRSSEDDDSSVADDQESFSVQGLRYGRPEEGSPSFIQLEGAPPYSESSSDANHASSISSSQIPYADDASFSFENFDRVSDQLNELRTRLQLPRLDSGASDVSSLPSTSAGRWEDSYILDVLIHSNFHDLGFDTLPIMWNYPDYHLNPALFDTLEEKYGDVAPELMPERLLLFDRINSALSEIFQVRVDLRPSLMPTLGLLSTRVREPTRDAAVENLISRETTEVQLNERILLWEMQWEDPVLEVASMGETVEELLLDDIIDELVCDFSGLMDIVYNME